MKTAGLPRDYDRIRKIKNVRQQAAKWRLMKAAVAYRVIRRYFKERKKYKIKIRYDAELEGVGGDPMRDPVMENTRRDFANKLANQILSLDPNFSDKWVRRELWEKRNNR